MQRNWSPTTEQELLLQAALGSGPAAVSAWRQWKAITDFDHYLDDDSFELLPLLYMNLRRHGVKDPLIHKLKGIYRRLWCENQLQFRVLAESLDRLNRAELPTLLLDAAGLSAKYYREPGLRKIKRSQVAVPVTRAKLATRVLAQSGWAIPARNDERHRFEQSVIFVNDSGRELEIRWDLALEQSEAG